jgi:hypothetical protein
MERAYQVGTRNDATLFVGTEVERTPAYGKHTLFVVGIHPADEIIQLAKENNCDHIYLGANHSFKADNYESFTQWENLARTLLIEEFWVTLDFDIDYCENVSDMCLNEHNRFIAMISAKIPYLSLFNYNACLKIDDKNFNTSNIGVWIHNLHELQDRKKFTDWDQYTNDSIIEN